MMLPAKKRLHLIGSTRAMMLAYTTRQGRGLRCGQFRGGEDAWHGMDRWPLPLMKNTPRHQEK